MAGIRKRTWTTKNGIKKTCYEITYYLNGKQYRKSGFKTKIEAQENLNEVTKNFKSGITFKKLKQEFFDIHCELNCKSSTKKMYTDYLKMYKIFDAKLCDNISQKDIETYIIKLRTKYSTSTINISIGIIKTVFKFGMDYKYISNNPTNKIKKIKLQKKEANFINQNDIPIFLEIAKKLYPEHYLFFYTAIYTGMRESELFALTWKDINFKDLKITINKQLYKSVLQNPKTLKSNRVIDIPVKLVKTFMEYKKSLKVINKYCFTINNRPYYEAIVSQKFNRIKKHLAKITNNEDYLSLKIHDLRHTFASVLLSNSAPIAYVQKQLGHSNCTTTLNIYNHCLPEVKSTAMNILNNIEYEHYKSIKA